MPLAAGGTRAQPVVRFGCMYIRLVQVREVAILAAFANAIRVLLGRMLERAEIAVAPRADAAKRSAWVERADSCGHERSSLRSLLAGRTGPTKTRVVSWIHNAAAGAKDTRIASGVQRDANNCNRTTRWPLQSSL